MRTGGKWRQFPQSSCAANQRESAKRSKYSGVRFKSFGKQRRYKFVFAFEDGGAYGDDAIMFLDHLSKVQKQHNEDLLERGEPVESPQDFQRELWTGLSRLIQSGVARRIRGVNLDVEFASLVEMHKRGVHFDDDSDLGCAWTKKSELSQDSRGVNEIQRFEPDVVARDFGGSSRLSVLPLLVLCLFLAFGFVSFLGAFAGEGFLQVASSSSSSSSSSSLWSSSSSSYFFV